MKQKSLDTYVLADIPIGTNIQRIRIERQLTQNQLVARMQVMGSTMSRSTLANIESYRRIIKASDLKLIKIILEADYESLFAE